MNGTGPGVNLKPALEEGVVTNDGGRRPKYPEALYGSGKTYQIIPENWDKSFPYYFDVLTADGAGSVSTSVRDGNFDRFILPLNPQSLSISIPFAAKVTATAGGFVEEHNGTQFRMINITGTTGITPGTGRRLAEMELNPPSTSLLSAVAPATTSAISAISDIWSDKSPPEAVDLTKINEFGHAQLNLLANWFVTYSEYKRDATNANARLVFVSLKDGAGYVCTPINFDCSKSKENPHLWFYKISLKVWRVFSVNIPPEPESAAPKKSDLTKFLDVCGKVLDTISAVGNLIDAVTQDLERIFAIAQTALNIVKNVLQVAKKIIDFPKMIAAKFKDLVKSLKNKISQIENIFKSKTPTQIKNIKSSLSNMGGLLSSSSTTGSISDAQNPFSTSKGVIANYSLLDLVDMSEVPLSALDRKTIDEENLRINSITVRDLAIMKADVRRIRDTFADSRNLGAETYDRIFERTNTTSNAKTATAQDHLAIKAFNDLMFVIDGIAAAKLDKTIIRIQDPFIRMQALSDETSAGLVINTPQRAFPVPFRFGVSLQDLAASYLGDSHRWMELAILNKLKPPYIDEEGFVRYFLTSGSQNSFTVSSADNLFLGQEVFLSSATMLQERRTIVKIDEVGPSNFLITVDGSDNLDQFKASEKAKVKAFLPNTINSNKHIYIPIAGPASKNDSIKNAKPIPILEDLTYQQRAMGVDIMITDDFDLAVLPSSNVGISAGFANAVQALRIKMGVRQGDYRRYLNFGFGIKPGDRQNKNATKVRKALDNAILSDPRFQSINGLSVFIDKNALRIGLSTTLAGDGGVVPVAFLI